MSGGRGNGPTPPDTTGLLRRAVPVVWLVLVWVLLWGTFSWANVLGGLVVALVVLVVFPLPPAPGRSWLRPGPALRTLRRFVADLVVSSLQVAWQSLEALRPGRPIRSSVVAVRLESSSEFVMAMAVEILSLVPGSLVIEARPEERTLYAHVLGADDAEAVAAFRAQVARLEADLVEALGRPQAAGAPSEEIP
ncbi:multisubunit sodium/proton antiporter MrpE subunit [Actinomycetospora succinea]|uniref:Multisubunit sodium/proton antiporter MrpE subunit n=1 Tax=Actinomycetospora succinea TaxID=663603 RepID=A0A4R6UTD1_9PSEU|nr:Na+/H+ antiporter subunit E [Actinomycetospora succinea]TDQ46664.1 multisubunit sodium/proton antiporter MrpE subunit [Actinomycetospora succinea]